jgi:sec-independent protein translocase protein TatC
MIPADEITDSFWGHFAEFRSIFIRSFAAIALGVSLALYFYADLVHFFTAFLPTAPLALFSPQEGIYAVCKLAFWTGTLLAAPYWIWSLTRFIMPGLRGFERSALPAFFCVSCIAVVSGGALCIAVSLPLANSYFASFNAQLGVNLWSLSAYLDFVLLLLFAHGIAFEMGALLFLLIHWRAISWKILAKKRRHAIVLALILGALLTTPDVLTQLLLAIPLYGFFELAIFYGKLRERVREQDHSYRVHREKGAIPQPDR